MGASPSEDEGRVRGVKVDEEGTEEVVEGGGETSEENVVEDSARVGRSSKEIRERDEGPRVRSRVRKEGVGWKGLSARTDVDNAKSRPRHVWAAGANSANAYRTCEPTSIH